jgi:hypothetical protein
MDWRRRLRARSEVGAVAVEAALVTPILMLLVFGIIEMALLMKDDVALTSAVRNGGRIASANANSGQAGPDQGGYCEGTKCDPKNSPLLAQMASDAIERAGTALPKNSINELWVFRANSLGFPYPVGNKKWTCTVQCIKYKWVDNVGFRYVSGTWVSKDINACANNNPDQVGIYMKAEHKFLTGFFSKSVQIDDSAIFTFEPLPNNICAGGSAGRAT